MGDETYKELRKKTIDSDPYLSSIIDEKATVKARWFESELRTEKS